MEIEYSNKNRKKVLLVSHEMTYTGAPKSLLKIAEILREEEYIVEVWTLLDGMFIEEFIKSGFKVNKVNFPEEVSEKMANSLKEYDLIIANTIFTASFACYAQHFTQTILYIREAKNIPQLIKDCRLNEDDLKKIKHMICVSEYAGEFIKEKYRPLELKVIHNFVEDVNFNGKICTHEKNEGVINILVLGTIEPRKGQLIAIKAFRLLGDELRQKSRLHLVGSAREWAEEYWNEIKKYFSEQIIYHGEIQKNEIIQKLYKDVDIVLIPSLDESCSLVALEAAMYGKAIIVTENVGAKYIVDTTCVVKTNDCNSLCKKLEEMIISPELLYDLGKKNRSSYERSSTKEHFKKEFFNYLESLKNIDRRKIRVSIIVLISNAESCLKECIESLVEQTLEEIEIICVNDASSDNSLNILKKYQKKDKRIKIISIEENSYGYALNKGISLAQGEYVGIVIPEDYVEREMYEILYHHAIAMDKDIVIGRAVEENNGSTSDGAIEGFIRSGIIRRSFWTEKNIIAERKQKIKYTDNYLWENLFSYNPTVMYLKKTVCIKKIYYQGSYYQDKYSTEGIFYKYRLNEVLNSKSFKIGRTITRIPRKIRDLINHEGVK